MLGDDAAVQVLEEAEAQIADDLSHELENLSEKQIEEQTALEIKQAEELINLEKDLRAAQQDAGKQVADQIEEQKQKVDNILINPSTLFFLGVEGWEKISWRHFCNFNWTLFFIFILSFACVVERAV